MWELHQKHPTRLHRKHGRAPFRRRLTAHARWPLTGLPAPDSGRSLQQAGQRPPTPRGGTRSRLSGIIGRRIHGADLGQAAVANRPCSRPGACDRDRPTMARQPPSGRRVVQVLMTDAEVLEQADRVLVARLLKMVPTLAAVVAVARRRSVVDHQSRRRAGEPHQAHQADNVWIRRFRTPACPGPICRMRPKRQHGKRGGTNFACSVLQLASAASAARVPPEGTLCAENRLVSPVEIGCAV
ncbi:protein of unknown function (plasmid) [Rhodovastum atsumiense]|nr:protein of unknown function [Rhodovastum atsumiense]